MQDSYLCEWTKSEESTCSVWRGCVPRDFGKCKTFLRYFCTKARRTSLWSNFNFDTIVCLQPCSRTLPKAGDAFDGEMSSTWTHRHFVSVQSHFCFLTRRFYHSRTRIGWIVCVYTAQGENIAIKNPIDWGRMDKDAFTIVLFVFSTQVTWREMPVISRQIGLRHDRTSFDKKNPKKNGAGQHTAFFTWTWRASFAKLTNDHLSLCLFV